MHGMLVLFEKTISLFELSIYCVLLSMEALVDFHKCPYM
jgi:hypothetical protein